MKLNFLALICLGVLGITLTLGLWPFHSPANKVSWLENRHGLRFGNYGSVVGSGIFQVSSSASDPEASVEIWLQPKRIWDSGTFLAFYRPDSLFQFSLRQIETNLLIRTEAQHDQPHPKTLSLDVSDVFHDRLHPVFITLTSCMKGTCIYMNGELAQVAAHLPLSAMDFTGRLVLGDSPAQPDNWTGQLMGLATYHRQLTAAQVYHNYVSWQQTGRPGVSAEERNTALYLFDERAGNIVRDQTGSGVDLYIPERYEVMDKIFLEPFWTEFNLSSNYWRSALKNIVGFMPFGFCFYAYLVTGLTIKRATLVTIVLGTALSLTIEILQAFLPTRDSGTTDIITNTIGSWAGVASYKFLTPILTRSFPVRNFTQQLYIPLSHYLFKRYKELA